MRFQHLTIAVLLTATLTACLPEATYRQQNSLMVDTFTVQSAADTQFRTFNGQVIPAELTMLSFRLDGELSAVLVKEGDSVSKGETLALLDETKVKQNLADAQAKYELALKQVQRGKDLRNRKMVSNAEFDELTANFELAQATLGAAQARMRYTRLKAPFDGVISSVNKKKYENVTPGEEVLSIYQDDQVYVKIELSDSVLAMLNPESGSADYSPQATFSGHVGSYPLTYLEHTSELHPQSQTYEFWLEMAQIEPRVLPGTSAKVSVDLVKAGLHSLKAYQLPMTAIDAGKHRQGFYVWKLENGSANRYPVNIDQVTGNGVLVVSGIKEGDVLINSNLRKLRDGMNIKGAEL
ncbi:efflux RND transporter periplasmic adaptor subunit [Vibrio sp. TH_r3]|uniref:efflux RND transporter periplasmic adaptor subunit n=1 Tax=Vibrio sp. TH_r3 TaxID=3082084 RepID=UPI002952B2CE|nr:efflux RND transporter periplasmic adaptor subunit [Vibrio sp. TH_r3]MDV7104569.1 efflux RND transporter periplasmic adaptor subunit [Vibrio sp. TH_r3]